MAPAAASADAVARPIPREAPVTKAVLLRRAAIFLLPAIPKAGSFRPCAAVVVTCSKTESGVQRRAPGTGGARRDWSRGRRSGAHTGCLLHDERVHRGHDHVVIAVHDECWLLDRLQIVVGPLLLDAPL